MLIYQQHWPSCVVSLPWFFSHQLSKPSCYLASPLCPTNTLLSLLPWSSLFSPKLLVSPCPRPQSLDLLFSPSKLILLVTSSRVMALNTYLLPTVTFTFPAQFSSVQSLSRVQLFVTPMTAAHPESLPNPRQLLRSNILPNVFTWTSDRCLRYNTCASDLLTFLHQTCFLAAAFPISTDGSSSCLEAHTKHIYHIREL